MMLLKRNDWTLVEVKDGLLKFKSKKYQDEYYMAKRAKVVDRKDNEVTFLNAESPDTFIKYLQSNK